MEKKRKYSRQRERILQYLTESHAHPSAETIFQALRQEIPGLSLGTVYRNLKLLEELGAIRKVAALQGTDRYDAICEDHAHFLCTGCGHIQDLEKADTDAIRAAILPEAGFRIHNLNVTLSGLCPCCAAE